MKYGINLPTKEQTKFLKDMEQAGHFVSICYTAEAAIEVISRYIGLYENQVLLVSALECREAKRNVNGIPVIY